MHAIAQNGTAEYRVRQALSEEKVRRHRVIPWATIVETTFALIAIGAFVALIWRSWR